MRLLHKADEITSIPLLILLIGDDSMPASASNTLWSITEKLARQAPSYKDLQETKKLFYDFNIFDSIPAFQSLAELLAWRKMRIMQALDNFKIDI